MRLSLDVIPHNYQICITPDLQKFTFEGHLVIQVEVEFFFKDCLIFMTDLFIQFDYLLLSNI